jgi:arginine:ornithine antiporter/lysine permease
MKQKDDKLGLWLLVFVGIGSMIGSGIFNSPKDLIHVANPQSTLIAWIIGGLGALMLAFVFIFLANRKPNLTSGIYEYAKDGFGDYMGFNAAWGYWSLGWLGNVSYLVLFFKTLNDLLGDKALSPTICFWAGSAVLWIYYFIIRAGIKEGAITNFIVTIAKLIPIVLAIVAGIGLMNPEIFHVADWQHTLASTGQKTNVVAQIGDAMAIILWCFVGVESASVLSGRAADQKTVQRATLISVLIVLAIYVLLTVISMSAIPAKELYASPTPIALLLEKTSIGQTGAIIVKLGIMLSVLGAGLSWTLLSVETMYAAARDGVMPKILARENRKKTPINALLLTQLFTQIFLLSILSPNMNNTYLAAITIGTSLVLIPYFLSSLYAVKISWQNKITGGNFRFFTISLLGTIYSVYVIVSVGLRYLIFTILFYAVGIILFIKAKNEKNESIKLWEKIVMAILCLVAAILIYLFLSKKIDL